MSKRYSIGVDYGSDSCRALLVDIYTGEQIATSVAEYARWSRGEYCDPTQNRYRQHPLDYIEGLERVVAEVLSVLSPEQRGQVASLSFDTTASTPVIIDKNGTPLSLLPEFAENPNAMFVLWKDHTAILEAEQINSLSRTWSVDYTSYSGGIYSSEWVWAKVMHIIREDEAVCEAAYSWAEHCDWMPALLTGNSKPESMIRSRCTAGHKAMWNSIWGGLPPFEFWKTLEPKMVCFEGHLFEDSFENDKSVGTLTAQWAEKLGLPEDCIVSVGSIDAHIGAIGAEIEPYSFVRVMGTSTCDMMVVSPQEIKGQIEGICGQVDGSILPGYIGLEAGQSAFGDIYAWFKRLLMWPESIISGSEIISDSQKEQLIAELSSKMLIKLSQEAATIHYSQSTLMAIDWFNGRRTPFANQKLTGAISGLTLGSSAPLIFRALVEATAYGSSAIVDSFRQQGVRIDSVVAIGGIAMKSPFVMQILSDVLGLPIKVMKVEQACALGAAMCGAVAFGVYPNLQEAQAAMGQGSLLTYLPDMEAHAYYSERKNEYIRFGKSLEQ